MSPRLSSISAPPPFPLLPLPVISKSSNGKRRECKERHEPDHLSHGWIHYLRESDRQVVDRNRLQDYKPLKNRLVNTELGCMFKANSIPGIFMFWYRCMDAEETTLDWDQVLEQRGVIVRRQDQFVQIRCLKYGEGYLKDTPPPFKVFVSGVALAIADVHAHLSQVEGAGLLLGNVIDAEDGYVLRDVVN